MTVRIGVIGVGMIGQDHIRRCTQVLNGCQIVAASDINVQSVQKVFDQYQITGKAYDNGHDVIASPEVDAILVTSSGPTHEEYVLAAIKAGKPVFCEKPLAVTAQGCERIVKAEMAAGKRLVQVGFMRSFDACYRKLKTTLSSGQLGEPLVVKCVHHNAEVGDSYTTDMGVTDSMVHEFDIIRWLLNDDYHSIQVVSPRRTKHAHHGVQDPQMVLLKTKKGVLITIDLFVNCQYGYDIRCDVVCEDGIAYMPSPLQVPVRTRGQLSEHVNADWRERFIVAYDIELQSFVDNAKQQRVEGPSAWDGFVASTTAAAGMVALTSGQITPVDIPDCPAFYRKA
ncbi:Gfo/Idh/MocA family oxidoreductase [Orbus sasakiae]|uniref:Inositol 2-dehydrogenase n=1 Tax=Orbus sasakiae TaxID=1078475 RepID=A0ABP9N9D3_9GAMM